MSVLKFFPCSFSDHDFVTLIFSRDYCPSTRGGVWKFNSFLLNDAIFIRDLSQFITDQKQCMGDFQTIGVWWDNLKAIIRNFCQKYCSCNHKSTNSFRSSLTKHLIRAKNNFAGVNESKSLEIWHLEGSLSSLVSCFPRGGKR